MLDSEVRPMTAAPAPAPSTRAARVAAIAIALIALGAPAAVRPAPHEDPEHGIPKKLSLAADTVRVPLELGQGQPIVAVKINGKGPFNFFLDSGAGGTVLNADLAAELALDSVAAVRIGDPVHPEGLEAKLAQIDKLEIGGARFENFQATAWDREFLHGIGSPRGVLGFPVYRALLATYDFPNKQLVLTRGELPPANGETVIDYEQEHNIPQVEIQVGA